MKTQLKATLIAVAIAISAAACSGNNSSSKHDTTSAANDTLSRKDSSQTGTPPGTNGSPAAIDSGMDHSGSGGTDTIEKPAKDQKRVTN